MLKVRRLGFKSNPNLCILLCLFLKVSCWPICKDVYCVTAAPWVWFQWRVFIASHISPLTAHVFCMYSNRRHQAVAKCQRGISQKKSLSGKKQNTHLTGSMGLNISREKTGHTMSIFVVCQSLHMHLCVINPPVSIWLPRVPAHFKMKQQTLMLILALPPVALRRSVTWQQHTERRHSLLPRRWLTTRHDLGHPQTIPTSCFIYSNNQSGVPASLSSRRLDAVSVIQHLMRTTTCMAPWVILWTTRWSAWRGTHWNVFWEKMQESRQKQPWTNLLTTAGDNPARASRSRKERRLYNLVSVNHSTIWFTSHTSRKKRLRATQKSIFGRRGTRWNRSYSTYSQSPFFPETYQKLRIE